MKLTIYIFVLRKRIISGNFPPRLLYPFAHSA